MAHSEQLRARVWIMLKSALPWLVLLVLVIVPVYFAGTIAALKSGLLDFDQKTITNDQYKAVLVFIASGLGAAITATGMLFTRAHNARTLSLQHQAEAHRKAMDKEANARLELDTAVRVLELISYQGGYAPKGRVAGGLATLVQLGHPVIAMRVLSAAWQEGGVDDYSATWLIDQVFTLGSDEAKEEASALLRLHAPMLTGEGQPKGFFSFPKSLQTDWPKELPPRARLNNLVAMIAVIVSKDRNWWNGPPLLQRLIWKVMEEDPDRNIRATAAAAMDALQHESQIAEQTKISTSLVEGEVDPALKDYLPMLRRWSGNRTRPGVNRWRRCNRSLR